MTNYTTDMKPSVYIRAVCTKGKDCTGSIDGITFRYADGSTDKGITQTVKRTYITDGFYEDILSEVAND